MTPPGTSQQLALSPDRAGGPLLRFPFQLKDFQLDTAALTALSRSLILGVTTGGGKTACSLAAMAMLIEDDKVDHVIIEVEVSKLEEWEADVARFTTLVPVRYAGTTAKRAKLRKALPQVLVGVYETFRGDLAVKVGQEGERPSYGHTGASRAKPRAAKVANGPLLDALLGKRVLVIQDEGTAKMGASRTSWMYKAHERARAELLKHSASYYCWPLSATPMVRDPVGYFNVCRLLDPGRAGRVDDFTRDHVASTDEYNRPKTFKNLDRSDEPWVMPLTEKLRGLVVYRGRAEPEVAQYFPTFVASPPGTPGYTFVDPSPIEQDFYQAIYSQYADGSQQAQDTLWGLMRLVTGHPFALARSGGAMAADIVRLVGRDGLAALPTTKLDAFVDKLRSVGSDQVVSFTYFANAVLPLVHERLVEEGFSVVLNRGELSPRDRERSRDAFNAGEAQVYLSSDAGARGINLPAGKWAIDYELPLTDEVARQRRSRIDRIDSTHRVIHFTSMVMRGTVEMGIAKIAADRQAWSEQLGNEDGSGLSAAARKYILAAQRSIG
jgi:Helicase conserved C-terminal domain